MISLDQIQAKFGIGKSESEDQDDHNQIDLELDKMLLRVRSVLYELYIVPTNKLDLEEIYGKKLFKCSRTGCESFFEGFTSSHDLEEHEAKHEQVCCSFEGCAAIFCGKQFRRRYSKHVYEMHTQGDGDTFPKVAVQTLTAALKEAIRERDHEGIRSIMILPESNAPPSQDFRPFFNHGPFKISRTQAYDVYRMSAKVWKLALEDPSDDIIRCLTSLTTFEDTNAQALILEYSVNSGRRDLVKQFIADEYHRGKGGKYRISWDLAIEAAIRRNDGKTLGILVGAALRNPAIELKDFNDSRLRHFCTRASRMGALSCVQYFVDEHLVDPFSSKRKRLNPNALERLERRPFGRTDGTFVELSNVEKLWNNRSILFHVVEMGHNHILVYLLRFRGDERFSALRSSESFEQLIRVAAVNGHEPILSTLVAAEGLDDETLKRYKLLSLLHDAIRSGKEQYAKVLIRSTSPLDLPDRNYCTPLMYAAYHGMMDIVVHLVLENVNVDQWGIFDDYTPDQTCTRVYRASDMANMKGHVLIRDLLKGV